MKWLVLLLGVICNASASLLIKLATIPPRRLPSPSDLLGVFSNWPFCLGLILYATTLLFYTVALKLLPLNVAHPVMTSGAVAAVALFSFFILKEPFRWTTITGIGFVITGVFLITLSVR